MTSENMQSNELLPEADHVYQYDIRPIILDTVDIEVRRLCAEWDRRHDEAMENAIMEAVKSESCKKHHIDGIYK